jgi:O-methyltransferase
VEEEFAEFGCFEGYSSAMLSYACRELELKMHILDSFEDLPLRQEPATRPDNMPAA